MASVWRVVNQRPYDELSASGQFTQVVEITFELVASGITGTVIVPAREYGEETVRQRVDAAARTMNAVQGMEG